ncbi:MAG: hypothetical protein GQ527_06775, partial [Bacteroidales bacterium]|nr:hypothetical protein [Bacteroidales bacterium]
VLKLTEALSKQAPSFGVVPEYESPSYKFLQGRGEILLGLNGPATTLWEFLIYAKESEYPLYLEGSVYKKIDLLNEAAQLLPHIPETVQNWVGQEGYEEIWQMCVDYSIDPELFE